MKKIVTYSDKPLSEFNYYPQYLPTTPQTGTSHPVGIDGSISELAKREISRYSESDKFWNDVWHCLFTLTTIEDLSKWEQLLGVVSCDCASFYRSWKAKNKPIEPIPLRWKYDLKTVVNAKLKKTNLSWNDCQWLHRFNKQRGPVHFLITYEDMVRDARHLARTIFNRHPNVMGIAGVVRSGMVPASIVALTLGVDLYKASKDGFKLLQGGIRRTGTLHGERRQDNGPMVIVDDSTCSGYAKKELAHLQSPFYTVYAATPGRREVNGYVVPLELPHFFEWNLMHNGIVMTGCKAAFDMDGVFCEDCPVECDDDGERYLDWMRRVQPLNWSIEYEVPTIITARREVYREQTLDWLGRHGVRVRELVMYQGTFEERSRIDIGQWKAGQAKQRGCKLFVESCYSQAVTIAREIPDCQVVSIERPDGRF